VRRVGSTPSSSPTRVPPSRAPWAPRPPRTTSHRSSKIKNLKAEPVKKDAIDQADQGGETFTSIFLLFGQFSVAAGVLLIFLIFVMLAAERKHELSA
jgi:hypothetical protein